MGEKSYKDFGIENEGRGIRSRLARMFNPESGRTLIFAIDHGYFMGVTPGLETIKKVEPLFQYCDAISPTMGSLKYISPDSGVPIILRATGGNTYTKPEEKGLEGEMDNEVITALVKKMARDDIVGFTASVYHGFPRFTQTLKNMTDLKQKAQKHDLITIGITAVGDRLKELYSQNPKEALEFIKKSCRILSENGADIVKTYYIDGFEEVAETCLSATIIAGGSKRSNRKDVFDLAYNSVRAGACGLDFGRNISQDENPVAMIQTIGEITHNGLNAKEAIELYGHIVNQAT